MLISIITVSFNATKTIEDTIQSVLSQTYPNIEYIVIDGNSKDGTVDIIKKYKHRITKFISEPDKGIYDAMNKGLALCSGDVVGILNSDDFYFSNTIIEEIMSKFLTQDIDCLFGDLIYVDSVDTNKIIRYWKSKPYTEGLFKTGWHPAHPTFFVKRTCYTKYGNFNLNFSIASDYEICLRLLEKHRIKSFYLNKIIVKMRTGGESNRSVKNILNANRECLKAWKVNDLKPSKFLITRKIFSKIIQMLAVFVVKPKI